MATSVRKILAAVIASVIFSSQLLMIGSMLTGNPILIGIKCYEAYFTEIAAKIINYYYDYGELLIFSARNNWLPTPCEAIGGLSVQHIRQKCQSLDQ